MFIYLLSVVVHRIQHEFQKRRKGLVFFGGVVGRWLKNSTNVNINMNECSKYFPWNFDTNKFIDEKRTKNIETSIWDLRFFQNVRDFFRLSDFEIFFLSIQFVFKNFKIFWDFQIFFNFFWDFQISDFFWNVQIFLQNLEIFQIF